MSNFTDFVEDYPKRCHEVLTSLYPNAEVLEREVTLLLCIASAGLVTPFERLRDNPQHPHPSKNRKTFEKHCEWIDSLSKMTFQELQIEEKSSWKFAKLSNATFLREVEHWELDKHHTLDASKSVSAVLTLLRHSLAHGNVYTKNEGKLRRLAFVNHCDYNNPDKGFKCLSVSPGAFKVFLDWWFSNLAKASSSSF